MTENTTKRLVAKTPADLAAFVPLALGFLPERSVVMISVGQSGGMHARVDLPHDPDDVVDVVEALLRPCRSNGIGEIVAVIYDENTALATDMAMAMVDEFTAHGIGVREVLRVHDNHWFAVLPGAPAHAYQGVPFDLAGHLFTAEGVLDGRVTHSSRDALKAAIAQDEAQALGMEPLIAQAEPLGDGEVVALVRNNHENGTMFTPSELASLAVTLPLGNLRDEAWVWMERANARQAVTLWSEAMRRTPDSHAAGPAAVLAFSAWLVGDGALAWCAIDRCREVEPEHSLAELVASLLQEAVSPDRWEDLRPHLTGI